MLDPCSHVGRRQGPRFNAFYGCMFYALMRPSEVAALTAAAATCPNTGWGHLTFADASPAAGKAYTDDGAVHEHRGLKGRTKGRPSPRARRPARKVPIPPELVALLRDAHPDVRHRPRRPAVPLRKRQPPPALHLVAGLQKARAASLTPDQLATPLMKRPYDLRHSGITWRLNSGVPAAQVAAWAGHSVEMLMRIYARCVAGLDDVLDRPHEQDPPPRGGPVNSGTHRGRRSVR